MPITFDEMRHLVQFLEGDGIDIGDTAPEIEVVEVMKRYHVSNHLGAVILRTRGSKCTSPWALEEGGPDVHSNIRSRWYGLPRGGFDPSVFHLDDYASLFHLDDYNFKSCAIDCLATTFKHLHIGFDPLDDESMDVTTWRQGTVFPMKELLRLLDYDWTMASFDMTKVKMDFYKACLDAVSASLPTTLQTMEQRYGYDLDVMDIWNKLTQQRMPVIGFSTFCRGCCNTCHDVVIFEDTDHNDIISLSNGSVSIGWLLNKWFAAWATDEGAPSGRMDVCPKGHRFSAARRIVKGTMPEVLVLNVQGQTIIDDTTPSRISFCCETMETGLLAATYGWLGSLCFQKHEFHYRVYWKDDDPGSVRMYDHREGWEFEKQVGLDPENRVPPSFMEYGGLIFLERKYKTGRPRSHKLASMYRDETADLNERAACHGLPYDDTEDFSLQEVDWNVGEELPSNYYLKDLDQAIGGVEVISIPDSQGSERRSLKSFVGAEREDTPDDTPPSPSLDERSPESSVHSPEISIPSRTNASEEGVSTSEQPRYYRGNSRLLIKRRSHNRPVEVGSEIAIAHGTHAEEVGNLETRPEIPVSHKTHAEEVDSIEEMEIEDGDPFAQTRRRAGWPPVRRLKIDTSEIEELERTRNAQRHDKEMGDRSYTTWQGKRRDVSTRAVSTRAVHLDFDTSKEAIRVEIYQRASFHFGRNAIPAYPRDAGLGSI
ncbi:hypothetical protein MMC24_005956 [Lignoscripta atroalba]|nr:hypothetical protein [Lignoscripta atroalba]